MQREINEKIDQFEEKKSKQRTIKRTSQLKNELDTIDYVPDDRQNSVIGKIYRSTKDEFNIKKNIGGKKKNKTKKQNKKTQKNNTERKKNKKLNN